MSKPRLLISNLYWAIREMMETHGMLPTKYKVLYAYPDLTQIDVYPTIAIDRDSVSKVPLELGADKRSKVTIVLDVLANNREQRDDISDLIQETFNDQEFTLYDFTSQFPTVVGNYSGIPSLGKYYVESVNVASLHPPQFSSVPANKYHDMLIMDIILPL